MACEKELLRLILAIEEKADTRVNRVIVYHGDTFHRGGEESELAKTMRQQELQAKEEYWTAKGLVTKCFNKHGIEKY